ncbi:hypothetical protein AB1Y20_021445 [Prymnesium parvum]|uniref:ADP ribosyltransferase domain-containing protein n=1 Tax=Prymnesium parvum TaxID=97485 RepID=A0AB34JLM3_PRYPA
MRTSKRRKTLASSASPAAARAALPAEQWTVGGWMESLELHAPVVAALGQKAFADITRLSHDDVGALLRPHGLAGLTETVWEGICQLRQQSAATGAALNAKFVAEAGTFEMQYGGLDQFWAGLEGLVGPPRLLHGSLRRAMEAEHCDAADSDAPFTTPNGFVGATSRREWEWVVQPVAGGKYVERTDLRATQPGGARCAVPLREFEARVLPINERLKKEGHAVVVHEELVSGRLYTAAMYHKYNAVLRGCSSSRPLRELRDTLTRGNTYSTTIHAINSLVIKLSKLTSACTVWRRFTRATLPREFWEPDAHGFRGGVEYGFCSTTVEREQAEHYSRGAASTIVEMKLGMLDRGADISWLSAYPHEKEVLFPPLLGLQVCESRVSQRTLVVVCRPSLNMTALTLEQVLSKRRKMLLDMSDSIRLEVRDELLRRGSAHVGKRCMSCGVEPIVGVRYESGHDSRCLCEADYLRLPEGERAHCAAVPPWADALSEIDSRATLATVLLRDGLALGHSPDWYNDDANFSAAVSDALAIRRGLCDSPAKLELRDCTTLRELPREAGGCHAVNTLFVVNAPCLTRLSAHAFPPRLATLDLHQCRALEALPASLGQCARLATLRLKRCAALDHLPSLAACASLRTLAVTYCTRLAALPPSLGACARLASLQLTGCSSLEALPPLSRLAELAELTLSGCRSLRALPDDLGGAASLTALILRDCVRLAALPPSIGRCARLEVLDCADCAALVHLPPESVAWPFHPFPLFTSTRPCDATTTTVADFGSCTALLSLSLLSCTSLRELPSTIGGCVRLQCLNLGGCSSLLQLPESLGSCAALEDLVLHSCSALESLPDRLDGCTSLRTLGLDGCTSLRRLPDISRLKSLDQSQIPSHLLQESALESQPRQPRGAASSSLDNDDLKALRHAVNLVGTEHDCDRARMQTSHYR